jgi:uncharacterized membrane protein
LTFVAVVFESAAAAEDALPTVRELGGEGDVSIRDAVVVVRTERGRVELEQTRGIAEGEAVVGAGSAGRCPRSTRRGSARSWPGR